MKRLDHLIYAVRDRAAAIEELTRTFGVAPAIGGSHPGRGTHNALLALGEDSYLEIMAADPAQPEVRSPLWCNLEPERAPRLATWVAKSSDLERDVERALLAGEDLGPIGSGSRRRTDGVELRWRMAGPDAPRMGGVIPFLIDWSGSPNPAASSPTGCRLLELRAEHPDAARARVVIETMGLELPLADGPSPRLVARLATPRGIVEIS